MTDRDAASPGDGRTRTGHRPDVQGLRALAVLAVVAYHAGVPGISGGFVGVDFFFVLSGFLITGLLVAEHGRSGRVSLRDFWARRARRLLPASSLVLVATAAASLVWLPVLQRRDVGVDVLWAALFGANWRFAQQETDYLAQDRTASPVLHFWSLGVEEQFYVVWPLLVVLVGLLVAARRLRPVLAAVFLVVVVASFAWSVVQTGTNQPYAFFGTPARAWQLGAGALLAVVLPLLRIPRPARLVLGALGLAGYVAALVLLSESGVGDFGYPGIPALLPTLAAVALLAAGGGAEPTPLDRALSVRPLQAVGDASYSWYLWHWPVLVLAPYAVGSDDAVVRAGAVLVSLVLALASYRLVEQPVRSARPLVRRPGRSLALGAALVVLAMLPAGALTSATATAEVTTTGGERVTLRPEPAKAAEDVFSMRSRGCDLDFDQTRIKTEGCTFGDVDGDRRVLLTGDSHAVAVFPGLERAARGAGWRIDSWTKSACPIADVTKFEPARGRAYTECDEWRRSLLERVRTSPPDVVVVSMYYQPAMVAVDRATGDRMSLPASRREQVAGLRRLLQDLTATGVPVLLVKDLPRADFSPPSCLVETGRAASCAVPVPEGDPLEVKASRGLDGVTLFDLRKGVCDDERCRAVLDDVVVYRDNNHITRTFALTLSDRLEAAVRAAVEAG